MSVAEAIFLTSFVVFISAGLIVSVCPKNPTKTTHVVFCGVSALLFIGAIASSPVQAIYAIWSAVK